jgi:hypothetical protein
VSAVFTDHPDRMLEVLQAVNAGADAGVSPERTVSDGITGTATGLAEVGS